MNDKMRFWKGGIMLTAVGLAIKTVSMFFGAYISRAVGAEGVGLFTLVMTVYSFAVTVATSGIGLTVTRLVASAVGEGKDGGVSRVMRGSLIYSLFFGALSTVLLFFCAELLADGILSDSRTVSSLKVLSFSLIPTALSAVYTGYFIGVKRVSFNAVSGVFCQLIKILLTVILVNLLLPYGTVSAVVGLCAGITLTELLGFLVILMGYFYDRSKNSDGHRGDGSGLTEVSKMAVPLAFSVYVRSILLNIEHILIPRKLRERGESTAEAYAHYGLLHGMALPLIIYPMSPLSSFSGLLVPEFAEDMAGGRNSRMDRIASKAINSTLVYAIICSVFIFSFSSELGYSIYDSYDAGFYISTLSFAIPIMYLDHVTDSMLKGLGEQVFSMWVNISDSLISVALVWILIPRMGIMGYALVIIIMEGYNFLLSFLRLKRKINFKINMTDSVIFPLISSSVSVVITNDLLSFGGRGISPLWLVMKIIFALSLTLIFLSLRKILWIKHYRIIAQQKEGLEQ